MAAATAQPTRYAEWPPRAITTAPLAHSAAVRLAVRTIPAVNQGSSTYPSPNSRPTTGGTRNQAITESRMPARAMPPSSRTTPRHPVPVLVAVVHDEPSLKGEDRDHERRAGDRHVEDQGTDLGRRLARVPARSDEQRQCADEHCCGRRAENGTGRVPQQLANWPVSTIVAVTHRRTASTQTPTASVMGMGATIAQSRRTVESLSASAPTTRRRRTMGSTMITTASRPHRIRHRRGLRTAWRSRHTRHRADDQRDERVQRPPWSAEDRLHPRGLPKRR